MANDKPQDDHVIAEYQRRRKEAQLLWNRNFAYFIFPAFAVFGLGAWLDSMWIALPAWLVLVAGLVHGVMQVRRHKRCPRCDSVQGAGLHFPFLSCRACGVRLSVGSKDSW